MKPQTFILILLACLLATAIAISMSHKPKAAEPKPCTHTWSKAALQIPPSTNMTVIPIFHCNNCNCIMIVTNAWKQ